MNRAKSVLDAPISSYGMISNGRVNIGSGITFATVQTMAKIDLTEYKSAWDIVVVDECHKAVGSPTKMMQFYKVLSALSCRYKIGVTATPKRADGLEKTMFALLGGIIHEVPKEAVAGNTCPVKVKFVQTEYTPDPDNITMGDGTLDYASLITDLTHDPERFEVVSEYIQSLGGSVLVLGNRVEYLQALCDDYMGKSMCLSGMGNSKTAKRMRAKALEDLNNGNIDCLFATYQLAKEGLDCPNLRYVVFATPEKDPTTVTQSAGRVGRKADNKPFGTVIDFVDDFGMYRGWQKKRMAVYKKLDFEII
jgi:superfamily II DNA or RNA helicase